MTQLRDRMLEELERRNYSPSTARCYLHAVQQFAEHFHRAPDRLGSRGRATSALERGKVFLNGEEALLPQGAARLTEAVSRLAT